MTHHPIPPILPCHYCNNTASLIDMDFFWVKCDTCLAEGPFANSEIEAIEKWNNVSALKERCERLEEALKAARDYIEYSLDTHGNDIVGNGPAALNKLDAALATEVVAKVGALRTAALSKASQPEGELLHALDMLFPSYKRGGFTGADWEYYNLLCKALNVEPCEYSWDKHHPAPPSPREAGETEDTTAIMLDLARDSGFVQGVRAQLDHDPRRGALPIVYRRVNKSTGTVVLDERPLDDLPFNRERWDETPYAAVSSRETDDLREAIEHILSEMIGGTENYFGHKDPKRKGRIRIATDAILAAFPVPNRAYDLREALATLINKVAAALPEANRRLNADMPKDGPVHPVAAFLTAHLAIAVGEAQAVAARFPVQNAGGEK